MSTWITYLPNHCHRSKNSRVQLPFSLPIGQRSMCWAGGEGSNNCESQHHQEAGLGDWSTEDPCFSLSWCGVRGPESQTGDARGEGVALGTPSVLSRPQQQPWNYQSDSSNVMRFCCRLYGGGVGCPSFWCLVCWLGWGWGWHRQNR